MTHCTADMVGVRVKDIRCTGKFGNRCWAGLAGSVVVLAQTWLTFGFRPKIPLYFRWHIRFWPNVIRHLRSTFAFGRKWNFRFRSTFRCTPVWPRLSYFMIWPGARGNIATTTGFTQLSSILCAYMLYYCNTVRWAWLDRGLSGWLTTLLQCFDTAGWVIRPVKRRLRIDLNCVAWDVKPLLSQSVSLRWLLTLMSR